MKNIISAFAFEGNVLSCEPYGNGHINSTFKIDTDADGMYILQKINKNVFKKPEEVMANVLAVTKHIASKVEDPRGTLTVIFTKDGLTYHIDETGEYWRAYEFIRDSICLDAAETPEDFCQSAVGFGEFQNLLSDFAADTLFETIPNFHNTADRYEKFKAAIAADRVGRAASVQEEIKFYLDREADGCKLCRLLEAGEIPLRVTHNDTKLNNVMLDAKTRKPLCVIDLDTVMPGLSVNDFGDSIRFGASTAAEDEPDLSKVWMDIELYRTYAEGFLTACGKSLTDAELDNMAQGAKTMTLECGMRFLTDYLDGDNYFRVHYDTQNLDRTRTHIKLVSDMEAKWEEMNRIVHEIAGR